MSILEVVISKSKFVEVDVLHRSKDKWVDLEASAFDVESDVVVVIRSDVAVTVLGLLKDDHWLLDKKNTHEQTRR